MRLMSSFATKLPTRAWYPHKFRIFAPKTSEFYSVFFLNFRMK